MSTPKYFFVPVVKIDKVPVKWQCAENDGNELEKISENEFMNFVRNYSDVL